MIWGDEALLLTGWPAGFDFDSAILRTDTFGTFILRFIQVCGVNAHQRALTEIATQTGWNPRGGALSQPVLANLEGSDPRELIGPMISIGPHQIGHGPRGLGDRVPAGCYAACLGLFGDIIGAKVFLPDERSLRSAY
ncbi:MAG: hypothetical protein ACKOE2_14150 [Actinomycetales bacterium]